MIEERLEEVKVTPVDDGQVDGGVPQFPRGVKAAESASENNNAMFDKFRITNAAAAGCPEAFVFLPRQLPKYKAGDLSAFGYAGLSPRPGFLGRISFPLCTRTPWNGSLLISRFPSRSA